jgi:hypothetical protein
MAIKLIANYAKRLGLPGYSSHQFSVSCETELTDLTQVHDEAARLYGLLQDSVDREIQQTGFVPGDDYGDKSASSVHPTVQSNGNNNRQRPPPGRRSRVAMLRPAARTHHRTRHRAQPR